MKSAVWVPQPFENEKLALAVVMGSCVLLGILIATPFILAERYVKRRWGKEIERDIEVMNKSPLFRVLYAMAIVARFFGAGGGGGGSWGGGGGSSSGGGASSDW